MKTPSEDYLKEKTWEEKAQENPLYGVMSHEEFAASGAEPTAEELAAFYSRGEEMVNDWIKPWLDSTGFQDSKKVLEFGCGMGRLTNALSKVYPAQSISGIDISSTMISHAIKNTPADISYYTIRDDGNFPIENSSFDRVYSYAVFQHISQRSVVENSLKEISRALKKGGQFLLNFEMIHPPKRNIRLLQDSYALENHYVVYGMAKFGKIPVWRLRINRSNNWGGIRIGYRQLNKILKSEGLTIESISSDSRTPTMVWFQGRK